MIPSPGTNAYDIPRFSTTLYDATPVRERDVVRQLIDRSTLHWRSFGHLARVAAPSYIESHGVPETPFDLSHHDCIAYTGDTDEYVWRFASGDDSNEMVAVPISGRLRFNNRYAIRQAVLKGLGVGLLQHYMIADDITSGRLIRLLPENEPRPIPIHIVYPSRATLTRRTRVVIDWLLAVLKDTVGFAAQN